MITSRHQNTSILRSIIATVALLTAFGSLHLSAKKYEAYIDSADNYASHQHYTEAARCYREALKANPASPLNSKIFANLGICLTETGQFGLALEAFDVALVREPKSAPILTSRAKTYILTNNTEDALKDLDSALSVDSIYLSALRLRGNLHMLDSDYAAAMSDFRVINRHYPDDETGLTGLARCFEHASELRQAIEFYKQALHVSDDPDTNVALAGALINDNQLTEAREHIREAIRRHPRCANLYLMRGVVHQRMFQPEEAATDKKTAINLGADPDMADKLISTKK